MNLEVLPQGANLRRLPQISPGDGPYILKNGRRILNLGSNDYLGLSSDRDLFQSFLSSGGLDFSVAGHLMGSGASRLLGGGGDEFHRLEEDLARWQGREAALLFNSGYHANLGVLSALAGPGDRIFLDQFCHASLMDGARLSGARIHRFNHQDITHLESLLTIGEGAGRRTFVVTEGLFSMDGDEGALEPLIQLKEHHDFFLVVDEAHSIGLYGQGGRGMVSGLSSPLAVDLVVGTFGKSFCSQGAFALCSDHVKQILVNRARTLIFSTALSPFSVLWTRFILGKMDNFESRRERLFSLSGLLSLGLRQKGWPSDTRGPILPLVLGTNEKALKMGSILEEKGYFTPVIRPPTVPDHTSRLRFSLRGDMDVPEVESLIGCIPFPGDEL